MPVSEQVFPQVESPHARSPDAVIADLVSSQAGLSAEEAERRSVEFGSNALPSAPGKPAWRRLLDQFDNFLIHLLLASAVAAVALGHPVDAAVIAAVVLVNALIGFIQEGKAERSMQAIGRMLAPRARVRRDGHWRHLAAEVLVPGDLVLLKAGDRVPADLRLIESHGLRIDQAVLTGESVPVGKRIEPQPIDTPLAERQGMAYAGSVVTAGQGTGAVVAIGRATELGRISTLLGELPETTTPLLRQIEGFGRRLAVIVFFCAALTVMLAVGLHATPFDQGLMIGVALAVAAIPEGLPAIITITLAIGVQRMARRNAIVRRLPAVETLGAVDVVCTDKTGTLTRNELVADRLGLIDGEYPPTSLPSDAGDLMTAIVLCNDASRHGDGDPLEVALIRLAETAGIDSETVRAAHPRLALLPFSSEHRLMATRHRQRICIKGAPEAVFARCSEQWTGDRIEPLTLPLWSQRLAAMTGEGLRVLAVAERRLDTESSDAQPAALTLDAVDTGLCLLGLVGFRDPPRPEVAAALAACQGAGVDVRMITGDHAATASAIAAELGILGSGAVLEGRELDRLDDGELARRVGSVAVFARTTPEHKLRLVQALQADGRIVAMTGDGANDAPALKRADIGVAMGIKGTEASRQAAGIVLADDNFASIVAGIEEGRGVFDNIRKSLLFILPTSAAEAAVILVAAIAGWPLPITPVQILWVNMVTAVTLGLALAFEPVEGDAMRRPPRPPDQGLIDRFIATRIAWVGALLTLGIFVLFERTLASGASEAEARSVALNALVVGEAVYLFNCRRWLSPAWAWSALSGNRWAWLSVALLVILQWPLLHWPPAQAVFGTTAISAADWQAIAAVAITLFIAVEIEKAALTRRQAGRSA